MQKMLDSFSLLVLAFHENSKFPFRRCKKWPNFEVSSNLHFVYIERVRRMMVLREKRYCSRESALQLVAFVESREPYCLLVPFHDV